jgi:hypothetical protein
MEAKQTAVEWLIQELGEYFPHEIGGIHLMVEKAKQMDKEQIKNAFVKCWESNVPDGIECKLDAEQYYNETYGK